MSRFIVIATAVLGTSSLLLVDSAIKGGMLLALAALVALLLRRDSAASRHLVWQVAIVGMLAVPVFSAVLPQWRVLPAWAVFPEPTGPTTTHTAAEVQPAHAFAPQGASDIVTGQPSHGPTPAIMASVTPPPTAAQLPEVDPLVAPVGVVTTEPLPESPQFEPAWLTALPVLWVIGFSVLILRLLAARLILWSGERRGSVIVDSQHTSPADQSLKSIDSTIVNAFQAACRQLAVAQPVRLLIHAERTIPVVWGIFRLRLLLPDAARTWSPKQLQSVLLHELAHIKRRDAISQLLAQMACALHWFNPLVWFASWRLHVERERACDDLVLASGVRPSEYAEHLLDIATRLSPARWTQACGLAMARKSSLEGRLTAVLSEKLNRRSVPATIGVAALIVGIGIAVPVAMLHATDAVSVDEAADSSATDVLTDDVSAHDTPAADETPATDTAAAPETGDDAMPADTTAAVLLKRWQALEERRSPISEESVKQLRVSIDQWIRQSPVKADAARVRALRDWNIGRAEHPVFEVSGWLSEIAAIHRGPLEFAINGATRVGSVLSEERQASLNFGPVAENGLRAAWSRYPDRDTYVVGDVVTSMLVLQNASDKAIEFQCPYSLDDIVSWEVKAQDGRPIDARTIRFSGSIPLVTWRLKPGEVTEIGGRSVTIGDGEQRETIGNFPVSTVLHARRGEDVTVRWRVRKPVVMTTGDVKFSMIGVDDVPVWSTRRAGRWRLARGVTMEVRQQLVHAADVMSTAILTWPQDENGHSAQQRIFLAGDFFANREPWQLAWERGASQLWTMKGRAQSPQDFPTKKATPESIRRIDFSDPARVTESTWSYLPEVVPASIRKQFLESFLPMTTKPFSPAHAPPSVRFLGDERANAVGNKPEEVATVEPQADVVSAAPAPAPAPAAALQPEHEDGQRLFRIWQAHARTDGKIPGAWVGQLGEWVKYFIELNDGSELSAKFTTLLPRFDASHDWTQTEAVALLNDVGAVHRIPLSNALGAVAERVMLSGDPLPPELKHVSWGRPNATGLRVAWYLQHEDDRQTLQFESHKDPGIWNFVPSPRTYQLGSVFKSRILVHNAGKQPVFFVMPSWQQSSAHAAHDDKGNPIEVTAVSWTTRAQMRMYRLAPGAYLETSAPGIGVGAKTDREDWANLRPGAWIHAKEGDEVRLIPGNVEVRVSPFVVGTQHGNGFQNPKNSAELWDAVVAERVSREMPVPVGAADREQLLRRVVRDLYGVEPEQSEIDAFITDQSPGAGDPVMSEVLLRDRVKHGRTMTSFNGTLPPGELTFRVLAADPNAGNRTRFATVPGYYILGDNQRLHVEQTRSGERRVNQATIRFFSPNPKTTPAPEPVGIRLPDGVNTFAIWWDRGSGMLWVTQEGLTRKYDFTNPNNVKETRPEPGSSPKVPVFGDGWKNWPAVPELPGAPLPDGPKPDAGTRLEPGGEADFKWGEPVNGLRAALSLRRTLDEPEDLHVVIQNVSDGPIHVDTAATDSRKLWIRLKGVIQTALSAKDPERVDVLLEPREVAFVRVFSPESAGPDGRAFSAVVAESALKDPNWTMTVEFAVERAPTGSWQGKLRTPDTSGSEAAKATTRKSSGKAR